MLDLNEFPIEGQCIKDPEIVKYLSKTKSLYDSSIGKENNDKYYRVSWSGAYYWFCSDYSSKTKYNVRDLVNVIRKNSIEKWRVGSYVVAIKRGTARLQHKDRYDVGFVDKITHSFRDESIGLSFSNTCCNKLDFKWFATKSEAEEFSILIIELEEFIEKFA